MISTQDLAEIEKYVVHFDFNVAENGGSVELLQGDIDVTTDIPPDKLKNNEQLLTKIVRDMQETTRKHVFGVVITLIRENG